MDAAAIRFELCFARASGSDAAAQARHLDAASGEAGQHIIQLGQLDLQLPFTRAGTPGEYVEDQLRAVENFAVERALEIALLRGREIGIKQDDIEVLGRNNAAQLFQFSRSDQGGGI